MLCYNCKKALNKEEAKRTPPICDFCRWELEKEATRRNDLAFTHRIGDASQMLNSLAKRLTALREVNEKSAPPDQRIGSWLRTPGQPGPFRAIMADLDRYRGTPVSACLFNLVELPRGSRTSGGRGGLSCHSVGEAAVWAFDLTAWERQWAHSAALACAELVDNTLDMLRNDRGDDVRHLIRLYLGDSLAGQFRDSLIDDFECLELSFAKPIVLYAGADGDAKRLGKGRTRAYVDAATDSLLAGDFIVSGGRCVYLPPPFFEPDADARSPREQRLFKGATILHELTHIVLGKNDRKVKGNMAYGRPACMLLGALDVKVAEDNADTFAFLALDLMLLRLHGASFWGMYVPPGYHPGFGN